MESHRFFGGLVAQQFSLFYSAQDSSFHGHASDDIWYFRSASFNTSRRKKGLVAFSGPASRAVRMDVVAQQRSAGYSHLIEFGSLWKQCRKEKKHISIKTCVLATSTDCRLSPLQLNFVGSSIRKVYDCQVFASPKRHIEAEALHDSPHYIEQSMKNSSFTKMFIFMILLT